MLGCPRLCLKCSSFHSRRMLHRQSHERTDDFLTSGVGWCSTPGSRRQDCNRHWDLWESLPTASCPVYSWAITLLMPLVVLRSRTGTPSVVASCLSSFYFFGRYGRTMYLMQKSFAVGRFTLNRLLRPSLRARLPETRQFVFLFASNCVTLSLGVSVPMACLGG